MSYSIPLTDQFLKDRVYIGKSVVRYVRLGDVVELKEGVVDYIHPQERFYKVRFTGKGGEYCQCYPYWRAK